MVYKDAQNLQQQLDIFAIALDKMQSDDTHLSVALEIWFSLLNEPLIACYHEAIRKRFESAVTPYHYLKPT